MKTLTKTRKETASRSGAVPEAMEVVRCRVLAADEGLAVADTPRGTLSCRPAASCLLRPEPGDLALVALPVEGQGPAFVLAVLERGDPESPAVLDLRHGARLAAPEGAVEIEAGTGLKLSTQGELAASAGDMTFTAGGVRWLTSTFSFVGKVLELITERFSETSVERETQSRTWMQRLGDCFRHVEDLDETQAGMVRTLAKDTALLHGRVTYVQAEEFVKADGQEVHLG